MRVNQVSNRPVNTPDDSGENQGAREARENREKTETQSSKSLRGVRQKPQSQASDLRDARAAQRAQKMQGPREMESAGASQASHYANESANTTLSARGKEYSRAKEIAQSAPDIREEKIAELKKRIAAGKYQVDSEALAEKIWNEHLKTE